MFSIVYVNRFFLMFYQGVIIGYWLVFCFNVVALFGFGMEMIVACFQRCIILYYVEVSLEWNRMQKK